MRRSTIVRLFAASHLLLATVALLAFDARPGFAAEPDPKSYWDVNDVRPGMKGVGQTVMVGTKLEEFGAEVLGVMRGVSPGRDMILCRLTGCNLEHAGIIQGMSGSPIYIDGKLLGAVAFAWEFGKDPIAGVTPFQQMVEYVRANDRRIAAEGEGPRPGRRGPRLARRRVDPDRRPGHPDGASDHGADPRLGGALAGMRPIATPLAASGFSPRALAFLGERLRPLGMAAMAGGAAPERVIREEGDKPLVPGAPLSIAMVTGDFDLSGIGTVTHVEGDRVYGFGHPMFSLGACEFPMMTGYIHTVYPRASVSMKMGSPLKVVGVIDTDVSTGVAGRIGLKPDMIPISVKVKAGRYSRAAHLPRADRPRAQPAADPGHGHPDQRDRHRGQPPRGADRPHQGRRSASRATTRSSCTTRSAARATPARWAPRRSSARRRASSTSWSATRWPRSGSRRSTSTSRSRPGRTVATIESVRLASDRLEPGQPLKAFVTLKPFKGDRQTLEVVLPLPPDLDAGTYEASVSDMTNSLRRRIRNEPSLMEPRDLEALLRSLRFQTEPRRTALYLHVPLPDRGLAIQGQALPNLPASARAVFATGRQTQEPPIRADLIEAVETPWVVEGSQSLKFTVVKDAGLSLK